MYMYMYESGTVNSRYYVCYSYNCVVMEIHVYFTKNDNVLLFCPCEGVQCMKTS